ncbi:Trp biosynthesis protein [Frankia sp. AiPs1]|uniref:hypothetical protein n=1 Tax=Frankia sp. AiPa1 TaxID=573492 RepID=UPI00202AD75F|nr:hypothetical protein [Frankia sp. AiPa1]MCL9760806.1 hypothetical protein [Frankia sp. AiPa1]
MRLSARRGTTLRGGREARSASDGWWVVGGQQDSPWARPARAGQPGQPEQARPGAVTPDTAADERSARVADEVRRWRARAVATADPSWSREGSGDVTGPGPGSAWWGPVIAAPWDLPSVPGQAAGPAGREDVQAAGAGRRRGFLAGPLAMAGGLGVIVASGMRWATVRAYGFIEFSLRGTDPGQYGRLTVVLGVLAVLAGLLLTGRRWVWGRTLAVAAGILTAAAATTDLVHLHRSGPFQDTGLDADVTVGPGVWLVLVCGLVVLGAGLVQPRARRVTPIGGTPG